MIAIGIGAGLLFLIVAAVTWARSSEAAIGEESTAIGRVGDLAGVASLFLLFVISGDLLARFAYGSWSFHSWLIASEWGPSRWFLLWLLSPFGWIFVAGLYQLLRGNIFYGRALMGVAIVIFALFSYVTFVLSHIRLAGP